MGLRLKDEETTVGWSSSSRPNGEMRRCPKIVREEGVKIDEHHYPDTPCMPYYMPPHLPPKPPQCRHIWHIHRVFGHYKTIHWPKPSTGPCFLVFVQANLCSFT